jgi:hypothetical protein
MNRRQMIGGIGATGVSIPLAGCGEPDKITKKRFRVIATAEVDGQRFEGSTVMEAQWRQTPGGRTYSNLFGETLILELGKRGTVFLLPIEHDRETGAFNSLYHGAFEELFRAPTGEKDKTLEAISKGTGRHKFLAKGGDPKRLPAFIAFKDERLPRTVYELDPFDLAAELGPGVRFIGLEIEITDAPLTSVLKKRLPWLVSSSENPGFDRDPPGQLRALKDRPFNSLLSYDTFFGDGSL